MTKMTAVTALILVSLFAEAIPVRAQERIAPIVGTWEGVKALPPKDELKVTLKDGHSKKGRLISVTDIILTLSQGKKSAEVSRESIFQVHRSVPKSREKGTWIGGFVGTGLGVLTGLFGDGSSGKGASKGVAIAGVFLMAGIGALIGRGLAKSHEEVLIYEARR